MSGPRKPIPADPDPLLRLRKIVHSLRAPGGCPWDIEQTHESLIPNLIEEAYETADALRHGLRDETVEELGDLLLQVVMHAEIGSESGRFQLEDIARAVGEKLVRRHPHVFGTAEAGDTEAVLRNWDAIKRSEKGQAGDRPILESEGRGLPALMAATHLQKRAAKVGFDWPDASGALDKVREEMDELASALENADPARAGEELGDLFFSLVNFSRKRGLDAESVLAAANEKFRRRFTEMEALLARADLPLTEASLEQMDAAWNRIKEGGPTTGRRDGSDDDSEQSAQTASRRS